MVVNGSAATTTTPYRTQRVHLHNLLMIHAAGRSAQSGQLQEAFRCERGISSGRLRLFFAARAGAAWGSCSSSLSFPFFLLPPLLLTQPEHFSGAFLSASTLAHSASVIFKCSHLSSAARRSIEAERKHGGMRLSCAPAVFARNKNNYFSLCLLSACCHPVWKPRASSERGGRQPEQHQHVARSSSRSAARF